MDTFTNEQRSRCMSKIKSKNTKPELAVRKVLINLGVRYRLHDKKLPGKPDISNGKRNFVLFINGCFWHQHEGCNRSILPKSNTEYWLKKLEHNIQKQRADVEKLINLGWNVFIIWECHTKGEKQLELLLQEILNDKLS